MKPGPRPQISPEQLAQISARYPHEDNDALAADFGITKMKVRNWAHKYGWKKSPAYMLNLKKQALAQRNINFAARSPIYLRADELAKRYPHESNLILAQEFGVGVDHLVKIAIQRGLKKSDARIKEAYHEARVNRGFHEIDGKLIDCANEHRATGMTITSAVSYTGGTESGVTAAIRRLVRDGKLLRVEGRPIRFFADSQSVRDFEANRESIAAETLAAKNARKRAAETEARGKASQRKREAAKRHIGPAHSTEEAILPTGVKIMRLYTPPIDYRYQVAPGAEVPRLFSLVPVGVNPITGQSWGQA